jgi:hypothetical protein
VLTVDSTNRLIISSYSGKVTRQDVLDRWAQIRAHREFDPAFSLLVDCTGVTSYELTYEDQRQIAAQTDPFSASSLRIYVANSAVTFGMLRVYQTIGEETHQNVYVVRSLDEANKILAGRKLARSA